MWHIFRVTIFRSTDFLGLDILAMSVVGTPTVFPSQTVVRRIIVLMLSEFQCSGYGLSQ